MINSTLSITMREWSWVNVKCELTLNHFPDNFHILLIFFSCNIEIV